MNSVWAVSIASAGMSPWIAQPSGNKAGREYRGRARSRAAPARVQVRDPPGQPAHQGTQLQRVDDFDLGAEREHVERGGVERADPHPGLDPALTPGGRWGAPADPDAGRP